MPRLTTIIRAPSPALSWGPAYSPGTFRIAVIDLHDAMDLTQLSGVSEDLPET